MPPLANLATDLIDAAMLYGQIGAGVAAAFLLIGLDRIDPSARGAYLFRPLIFPGAALLWPLVIVLWWRAERHGKPSGQDPA